MSHLSYDVGKCEKGWFCKEKMLESFEWRESPDRAILNTLWLFYEIDGKRIGKF